APAPARAAPTGAAADLQATAGNAAVAGLAEDGGFTIDLGRGIRLSADRMEGRRARVDFDESAPQPVPGLRLKSFEYNRGQGRGTLRADLAIPFVDNVRGGVQISVDRQGRAAFQGTVRPRTQLGVLQNPVIRLAIDEEKNVSGE